MRNTLVRAGAIVALVMPFTAHAQTRVFLVRLGSDTVSIEKVVKAGNKVDGTLVRHLPLNAVLKYSLTLNADGSVASYEQGTYRPDGTPVPVNAQTGVSAQGLKMTFTADSVIREVSVNGAPVVRRTAVPKGTLPAIGGWYANELLVAAARKDGKANVIGFGVQANAANSPDIRIVGADSAEIVNGGFRVGVKTDRNGQIVHGDGSLTTQKHNVTVSRDADVVALASAWAARDVPGAPATQTNTSDTVVANLGGANVTVLYSRPAKRGREIWGKLVPNDTTWRLGADFATQLKTDKDLDIGGTTVAAGTYTLWLIPSATKQSVLVVNKRILDPANPQRRLWGTGWDPADDIAKIPVQAHMNLPVEEERFHLFIDKGMLMMHWDHGGYGVAIKAK